MAAFVRNVDPESDTVLWIEDDEFDLHQEIARASYADMLHDHERNEKYYIALQKAIKKTKEMGKQANVLDIGTGTGLLSMMAAKLGAECITACEAFAPMAKCAKEIIADNGFANRIHLIPKISTQLTVGPHGDMTQRANILVTEVFDSDFIGEGALLTFKHAIDELLEDDPIVVPSSGRVYVQIVDSEMVRRWNRLNNLNIDNEKSLKVPSIFDKCPGTYSVHDIQLSQFPTDQFIGVTEPQLVFSFDFTGKIKLEDYRQCECVCTMEVNGVAHAVFMWWDLTMDMEGEVMLSCAPFWKHPSPEAKLGPNAIPWRDHWMQEIYHLPRDVPVVTGQKLTLISCHDKYGFWFNLVNKSTECDNSLKKYKRPECICNLHVSCSYTHIGMLNDPLRRKKFLSALKKIITPESQVFSIGECSLLGLYAAILGAKKVAIEDNMQLSRKIIEDFISFNSLDDRVQLTPRRIDGINSYCSADDNDRAFECISPEADLIIVEPFSPVQFLPWHNLRWKPQECNERALVFPGIAGISAVPVQFDNLHKIRAPLNEVFTFSMQKFDELVSHSSGLCDSPIELQPLWEYGSTALSSPFELFKFNLNNKRPEGDLYFEKIFKLEMSGRLDAFVLWIEYELDSDNIISHGPITEVKSVEPGKKISWDVYSRQAVCFMKTFYPINVKESDELTFKAIFETKVCDLLLKVDLCSGNGDFYPSINGVSSPKFNSFVKKQ